MTLRATLFCMAVLVTEPAAGAPRHGPPPGRLATAAAVRHRVRLGMTWRQCARALRGLRFLPGGMAVFGAGPDGWSREMDTYRCADGTVIIGYSAVAYGIKPEGARVEAINGPDFFVGNTDAIP